MVTISVTEHSYHEYYHECYYGYHCMSVTMVTIGLTIVIMSATFHKASNTVYTSSSPKLVCRNNMSYSNTLITAEFGRKEKAGLSKFSVSLSTLLCMLSSI